LEYNNFLFFLVFAFKGSDGTQRPFIVQITQISIKSMKDTYPEGNR